MFKRKIIVFIGSRAEIGILKEPINILKKKYDIYFLLNAKNKKLNFFSQEKIKIEKKKIFYLNLKLKKTTSEELFNYLSKFILKSKKFIFKFNYDLAVVLGDRYEGLLFSFLCSIKKIPLIHFHGGEATYGAIDENYRHAITKLSSIHFTSTEIYKKKLIRMGENPKYVHNIGSMSYFSIKNYRFKNIKNLKKKFDFLKSNKKYILVTFHPETYAQISVNKQIKPILAITKIYSNFSFVFTGSNLDEGGKEIEKNILNHVKQNSNCFYFKNLGHKNYLNLMKYSSWVMGNSSSGIIEASLMNIKCLNIGDRQKGRIFSNQTITVKNNILDITKGINKISKIKNKKFKNVYFKENGLKIFKNQINKIKFEKLLPKFFYEKN